MADLFQSSKQNISHHIGSIFDEGELYPEAIVKNYLTVQTKGTRKVTRDIEFYNLDMVISVGYRVKSHMATRFRQWATQRIHEYIISAHNFDINKARQISQNALAALDAKDSLQSMFAAQMLSIHK